MHRATPICVPRRKGSGALGIRPAERHLGAASQTARHSTPGTAVALKAPGPLSTARVQQRGRPRRARYKAAGSRSGSVRNAMRRPTPMPVRIEPHRAPFHATDGRGSLSTRTAVPRAGTASHDACCPVMGTAAARSAAVPRGADWLE